MKHNEDSVSEKKYSKPMRHFEWDLGELSLCLYDTSELEQVGCLFWASAFSFETQWSYSW